MVKKVIMVGLSVTLVMLADSAFAARYPAANWSPGCNTFWATCVKPYHTGCDASGGVREAVYAPFSGVIKEAQYHGGYGGTIIGESSVAGETVTWVLGHLDGSDGFMVRPGQSVTEGQQLDQLAPQGYWSGNYVTHFHLTIRKGGYAGGATACDGGWVYHGYAQGCDWGNFLNPMLAIPFANVHAQQGGTGRVGYPITHMQYSCGLDYRLYSGGSYGECMIAKGDNGMWLVRTGFYNKYKAMGGSCSSLGKPRSNEYSWYDSRRGATVARQDFNGGYMIWYQNTAIVYNSSNVRIASASPALDESMIGTLSMTIGPNPIQREAQIRFSLPEQSDISLNVYDVTGRKVSTLTSGLLPAGEHVFQWSRTDDRGSRVVTGIYFVRLVTPTGTLNRRVIIVD